MNFPWKSFIKESPDVPINSVKSPQSYLNFDSAEARAAYEEIVQQKSDATELPKENSNYHQEQPNLQTNKFVRSCGVTITRVAENNSTKVSTNSILKAVEQGDLIFLKQHLTPENVNVTDDFGWTPLMLAAYCGQPAIVELLLKLGANKRARERSGLTAAQLALKKNFINIVALLRKRNILEKTESQLSWNFKLKEDIIDITKSNAVNLQSEILRQGERNKSTEFYCEICKSHFKETTIKKHETSTLHIFNTKPKLPSAIYGISKQNKGYKMLINTGWDEGGGLGPSGKGLKYPVKTVLKADRKGLGHPTDLEPRVTHFKPGDPSAIILNKVPKHKPFKMKDREKLLSKESKKERAIRIALS
ncbi:G patch domain and ankyrin repeat-containing protein 1 homolog [Orussus abietinus]|uniref:G patch domain and ankyrin repeat-containing protein 1 homolog n=1 Tax=Orussus abietinus TaxID=222816 RepID=UPI000626D1DB|nr:G patch domain and ankyrin repeat-containing protein 1 homolog [Orussus abietinus]